MADINLTRRHTMGKEDAKAATERVAQELEAQLNASYRWEGDTLRFERSGASGHLEVREDAVHAAIDLGLMLKPMKGRIHREAEQLLDKHLGE